MFPQEKEKVKGQVITLKNCTTWCLFSFRSTSAVGNRVNSAMRKFAGWEREEPVAKGCKTLWERCETFWFLSKLWTMKEKVYTFKIVHVGSFSHIHSLKISNDSFHLCRKHCGYEKEFNANTTSAPKKANQIFRILGKN